MHPILFRIPLPNGNLPYAWLPLIFAAIAALLGVYWLFAGPSTRKNSWIAFAVGGVLVLSRFTVLRGNTGSWALGPTPIYSYGVMLGLSLVVGWYLTLGLAERDGLPKETMANNYVVTAVAAVVGARLLYIVTNLSEFDSFQSLFALRGGGLVAYGGFLGGFLGSYVFLRYHKIPLLPWADVAVPSLASGVLITRIGCYLFGCDYGSRLSDKAPGFLKRLGTFPRWSDSTLDGGSGSPAWAHQVHDGLIGPDATGSLPVHPTQLYECVAGAALLVLLLWARRNQKFRGQVFLLFVFGYGVLRYLIEILRDDPERGSVPFSLPNHILIPFGLAILAIGYVIGFSQAIRSVLVRRITQVAAFVPVVALYLAMKPESFAGSLDAQYSTSQFIAILSGFAACVAFGILHKAALDHPETAMALGLPFAGAGAAPDAPEDEDEVRPAPKKKPAKKKAKKAGVTKSEESPATSEPHATDEPGGTE